jgi:Zn-dependent protease
MEPLFIVIVLILSVIAHEVAHGYAANALGDPTARLAGRLTLNPLPHIDLMGSIIVPALLVFSNAGVLFGWAKPVPYNPYNLRNKRWGEALVAVAGSATNILLAVIFAFIARATAGTLPAAAAFAALICFVNLFLGLFNLIPFPPMDGYTVLRGILPFSYSHNLIMFENRIRALGSVGIILVLILFSFIFIGPFGLFVAYLAHLLSGM